MKNAFVDFNCNYFNSDYKYDENAIYVKNIKRLVIGEVTQVAFITDYVEITYKSPNYKTRENTIAIELKYIKNVIVN